MFVWKLSLTTQNGLARERDVFGSVYVFNQSAAVKSWNYCMGVVISANEEVYCMIVEIRPSVYIRREKLSIWGDNFWELCQCRSWNQQLRPVTLQTVTLMVKGAVEVCLRLFWELERHTALNQVVLFGPSQVTKDTVPRSLEYCVYVCSLVQWKDS